MGTNRFAGNIEARSAPPPGLPGMIDFSLAVLFDEPLPRIKIVDVGALPVDGLRDIYLRDI